MRSDHPAKQGEADGVARKRVRLWVGGTPESESNLEVDALRNIGIDIDPGFRVKPRERPDHQASKSRFVPESGSNLESDPAAPHRYDIRLARRDNRPTSPGGEVEDRWAAGGLVLPAGSCAPGRGVPGSGVPPYPPLHPPRDPSRRCREPPETEQRKNYL